MKQPVCHAGGVDNCMSPSVSRNNLGGYVSATVDSDQITSRIDYNPKDSHQFFAQGSWLNWPVTSPGLFPAQGTACALDTELVALFSNPSSGLTAGNFGQIAGTQHDPREVQIGGILSF
jgi:hypothetical protein